LIVEYQSLGKYKEYYHIQNYTLTNTTDSQNISLYNLNTSSGQEFKITYKDSNFNLVPGAIIQIQRQYVDEGVFKTTEIPKLSSAGYTIAHLVPSDVIYNMIIIKDGVVLDSFMNIVANCQNPALEDCVINVNSLGSSVSSGDFSNDNGFSSILSYDKDTKIISTTYAITSGVSALTTLNATLFDTLGNKSICSDSLNSAGGTLSCTVPSAFGNSTVLVKITSGGVLKRTAILVLNAPPNEIYGANLIFISLILMLLLIGIAITDEPMFLGIMLVLGVIIMAILNLISIGSWFGAASAISSFLWLAIAIIIILIKGANRK
jgi:hypothetical protein